MAKVTSHRIPGLEKDELSSNLQEARHNLIASEAGKLGLHAEWSYCGDGLLVTLKVSGDTDSLILLVTRLDHIGVGGYTVEVETEDEHLAFVAPRRRVVFRDEH